MKFFMPPAAQLSQLMQGEQREQEQRCKTSQGQLAVLHTPLEAHLAPPPCLQEQDPAGITDACMWPVAALRLAWPLAYVSFGACSAACVCGIHTDSK